MADTSGLPQEVQDRLLACTDLVGRMGAQSFELRYSDDQKPVVWIAIAAFKARRHRNDITRTIHECAAAIDPDRAALRLVEQLGDGGSCTHCKRPTGVSDDWEQMPLDKMVCWYQYDPELKKFRRGCE